MNLVTVNIESIRIGQPLPFSLRDESGILVAQKGFVVGDRSELDLMIGGRANLFIDVAESEDHRRAYMGKLFELVNGDKPLGDIAVTQMSVDDVDNGRDKNNDNEPDWLDLQVQTQAMVRDNNTETFRPRLNHLWAQLKRHTTFNADATLFALMHLSASELRFYSATHAMLVSAMCSMAARDVLKWPVEMEDALGLAALTMNIGMTDLQDRLARQKEPPSPDQRQQIDQHVALSVTMLKQRGITDPLVLEAVQHHHTKTPGPLADRPPGQRLARLIQRADMFAACLAPRASRTPRSPAMAMQASYFDENKKIDEAGAALIKAVGIYSPGGYVRLATNEIAVVVKRGLNTTTPRVAVVINRSGMPTTDYIIRDTSRADYRIAASVPHHDVKVKLNLERLLPLTKAPPSDRLW
jgi:HD-GYP domain-containing protein (c-di-GMP phosphodiesterase class II)